MQLSFLCAKSIFYHLEDDALEWTPVTSTKIPPVSVTLCICHDNNDAPFFEKLSARYWITHLPHPKPMTSVQKNERYDDLLLTYSSTLSCQSKHTPTHKTYQVRVQRHTGLLRVVIVHSLRARGFIQKLYLIISTLTALHCVRFVLFSECKQAWDSRRIKYAPSWWNVRLSVKFWSDFCCLLVIVEKPFTVVFFSSCYECVYFVVLDGFLLHSC